MQSDSFQSLLKTFQCDRNTRDHIIFPDPFSTPSDVLLYLLCLSTKFRSDKLDKLSCRLRCFFCPGRSFDSEFAIDLEDCR